MTRRHRFIGLAASGLVGLGVSCTSAEREPPATPSAAPSPPERAPAATPTRPPSQPVLPGVDEYAAWVSRFDAARMNPSHEEVSDGLHRLAAALHALNDAAPTARDSSTLDEIGSIAALGDEITRNPHSLKHADAVRKAFDTSVTVLERLAGPSGAVADRIADLRRTAAALDPDTPLLRQRDVVEQFFRQARPVLVELGGRNGRER